MTSIITCTWSVLTTKDEARQLQGFTCTEEPPRAPGGRKLRHPRMWEWEAQALLRQCSNSAVFKNDGNHFIVVGHVDSEVAAAALLELDQAEQYLRVFVKSCGVALIFRRRGGDLANALVREVRKLANQRAAELGVGQVLVTGNIHGSNEPSEHLAIRCGAEPAPISPAASCAVWVANWTL